MTEPIWLEEARKHIGVRETKGATHTERILRWWQSIKQGGIKDDETPWCAAFVGGVLEDVGLVSTRTGWARDYLKWGIGIQTPVVGCVAVLSRDGGGGHVAFVVGRDVFGRVMLLGGNQGDKVGINAFHPQRVLGYRWPKAVAISAEPATFYSLPLYQTPAASTSEA